LILQEFVLGQELQLMCGGQVLDWTTPAKFAMKWKESSVLEISQLTDPGLAIQILYQFLPVEWFRLRLAHWTTEPKPSLLSVMLV
jgi:hypothetical protein